MALVVALVGVSCQLLVGKTSTLTPAADAYVTSASPNQNKGSSDSLRIDTAPDTVRSFLRFDLSSISGSITKATLRIYAGSSSNSGYDVSSVTDTTWSESTITDRTAPAVGGKVGTSGKVTSGTWSSIDVTGAVQGRTAVSFALTGISTTAIRLLSRETGATAPKLEVKFSQDLSTTSSSTTSSSTTSSSTSSTTTTTPPDAGGTQPGFPMRGAFYYPWFPQSWTQAGVYPYTNYEPSAGYYDGGDIGVVKAHIAAMQYANIQMGISSWWGQGHNTDAKFPTLLRAADGTSFKWALYYEPEGTGNPTVSTINDDLTYLVQHYGSDPSALRIDGRLVVFVYGDPTDDCSTVDRWHAANTVGAYLVMKVFPGYRDCAAQPDGWHQYAPASAEDQQGSQSYSISPGFWKYGEAPRLDRDLSRWNQDIRDMVASGARFQLVTTFNEWGEGTAVESATSWPSASGYGAYLDALHDNGLDPTTTTAPPPAGGDPRIAAVGDIACDPTSGSFNGGDGTSTNCRHKAVADLVANGGYTALLPLGDIQYESGAYDAFMQSYDLWFRPFKAITKPTPGNHEYLTAGAAGYYQYFGAAAGDPSRGYYSYDIGSWHIVTLNSNCSAAGGCGRGSPQETWLRSDLAASGAQCSIVTWHHPRYSSGEHGDTASMTALYQAAYDNGVDLVLSGHDHDYERFARQDANGTLDPRGVRQFVVGTGGKNHYAITTLKPNSQAHDDSTYGLLELTLHQGSYDWRFVPVAGGTVTDSGSDSCT